MKMFVVWSLSRGMVDPPEELDVLTTTEARLEKARLEREIMGSSLRTGVVGEEKTRITRNQFSISMSVHSL